ncbi:MAG: M28 family peptidase [Verrucomicrobiaceae bacterium]|nr:M28 family peptidase [Verrucomicrobiaceae bacterium]
MHRLLPFFLASTSLLHAEGGFLSNIRQLTFDGKRAGEGYFSADGSKMIFQSEREEGNPFYQIYLMDLETGDQERISPGMGKTTCAWIHPDGKRVLFASTHLDPQSKALQEAEIADRKSNRVRKYSWDYDEHYDLFEYSLVDKTTRQLTRERGYDAEGCWSPDGTKVAFASNRAAYQEKLSEADQKRMEIDKSYFMDIYIADADGSNAKRLTNVPGYDGGVFFSPDGNRLCWRRFDEKGMIAEVWTMNVDGTDQKQITKLGAMSWAPYFHPSGEYLIFTTNLHGFDNFELYIVDAQGTGKPVRVTNEPGFDGLPVFAPNGKQLAWTIDRTNNKAGQIHLADWNHEAALQALKSSSSPEVKAEDLRSHVEYLASDKLDGRLTGTEGEKLATQYVADFFASLKLVPAGDKDTWFDDFDFTAGVALDDGNTLTLGSKSLKTDADWRPLSFSQTGELKPAGVVFAGYGIETPEEAMNADGKKIETYSSYAHLEVKDKWVLVFRYLPEGITSERRNELNRYASLRHKALIARQKGARGIIVVSGPNSKVVDQLVPLAFDASLASSGIAAISVTDAIGNEMLKAVGKDLKSLQDKLDTGDLMGGIELAGVALGGKIAIKQERKMGRNVLAILPAKAEPDPHIPPLIIGAHVDHLGSKGGSNSRAKGDEADKIHHGADDNASGTAGMMEIAQWLADQKATGKLQMKRDIIFAAWSGEELGLLGSGHFVESFAKMITGKPDAQLKGMFAACLNMDMIGRFHRTVVLQGVGSSTWWPGEIEKRNAPIGLPITIQTDAHLPTDSTTFYTRGIPTLNAFTGNHGDYHMPSDTADKLDYEKAAQVSKLMGLIARGIVISDKAPDYVAMEAPKNQARGGFRVYLGTIPDYSQGDTKGVKLSGVSPVGPAAKAGVKGGDIIIKLGGKDVLNIYDYTSIMAELKVGVQTSIIVQREGKEVEMKVIPSSRD